MIGLTDEEIVALYPVGWETGEIIENLRIEEDLIEEDLAEELEV